MSMDMLKLHTISYSEKGKRINYEYEIDSSIQKFFNLNQLLYTKYLVDVSDTPQSLAVIPFLSNVLPIAWFAGFTIEVDEIDEDFYKAQKLLKKEFSQRDVPSDFLGGLQAKKIIKNHIKGTKTAMLYSGGVDAYATYIRIYDQKPDLITLLGADIEIKDQEQWREFTDFIETEELLATNHKEFIETNLRDFYTYQVELLLPDIGWWGKVQHGLALIGSVAPLSYIHQYKSIYIASSYTDHIDIDWGSTPEIDEKITWANGFSVYHDGYELKRQDKVDLISQFGAKTNASFRLRVCYSEKRTEFNCSYCEKCFRTILGLILNNQNPNEYGFNVDGTVYTKIYEILNIGSGSKGVKYFWWELMEKAKSVDAFFVFEDIDAETKEMNDFRNGKVDRLLEQKINKNTTGSSRLKFVIRNKFPWLHTLYRKLK